MDHPILSVLQSSNGDDLTLSAALSATKDCKITLCILLLRPLNNSSKAYTSSTLTAENTALSLPRQQREIACRATERYSASPRPAARATARIPVNLL